jgi:hypothetical protein
MSTTKTDPKKTKSVFLFGVFFPFPSECMGKKPKPPKSKTDFGFGFGFWSVFDVDIFRIMSVLALNFVIVLRVL